MYSPIKITFLPLSFRKEKENIFISRSLVTHHHNVISKRNKEMKNICVYNSTEFSDFACCRTQNFILFSFYFSFSIFRERQKKKKKINSPFIIRIYVRRKIPCKQPSTVIYHYLFSEVQNLINEYFITFHTLHTLMGVWDMSYRQATGYIKYILIIYLH